MLRLTKPEDIYQRLTQLRVGVAIPVDIFVADRADGTVPRWVVIERSVLPNHGLQLLVEDQSREHIQPVAASRDRVRPHRGILAFPDRIQSVEVAHGERSWTGHRHIDNLVQLAQRANTLEHSRVQEKVCQPLSAVHPPSPWYCAAVAHEDALPDTVLARLPTEHSFHQGTVIVVRRSGRRQWAAWDQGNSALILDGEIARQVFASRKSEDGHPLQADDQQRCEAGFREAMKQRSDKRPIKSEK